MKRLIPISAAVLALTMGFSASANDQCATDIIVGAGIGAIAGNLLSHGNAGGTIAGAGIGGIALGAAGCDQPQNYDPQPPPDYNRQPPRYHRPRGGLLQRAKIQAYNNPSGQAWVDNQRGFGVSVSMGQSFWYNGNICKNYSVTQYRFDLQYGWMDVSNGMDPNVNPTFCSDRRGNYFDLF